MTIDKAHGAKRPYAAPKLVVYGDMTSLTKTLAGSVAETATGPVMMDMKLN